MRSLPIREYRITPEEMNLMEPISFPGRIVLVDNEEEADKWLDMLLSEKIIGFDTESRPAFIKGQKFPVSIIQLSTEKVALIFQLKYTGFSEKLALLLSSADIRKVGVGINDDIHRLKELHDFKPSGFIDLSVIAKRKGLIQSGAKALTARYLGRKLVKSSQKTNWARKKLSDRQLEYAATDAWICLQLLGPLEMDKTDYFALAKECSEHETDE